MHIEEIGKQFNCKIKFFKPMRAVYIAETDCGSMIVKEVQREPDKILYIHGLKEYLYENGFTSLDRYLLSNNGLPFVFQDNRIFVMEKFISGRESSFENPFDRDSSVTTLARLHKSGKGYTPLTGCAKRNNVGKWSKDFLKKLDYLNATKQEVKKKRKKDRIDKIFEKNVDFMIHMAWVAFDTLKSSGYEEACKRAEKEKTICHHDYTYHNILISTEGEVNVIDFDYSCHELPIYDLAGFVLRVLKRFSFDIDIALNILDTYNKTVPLTRNDLQMMQALFEFPQRFWRITERYYENKTEWSEKTFIKKYSEILEAKDFLYDFTLNFRRYL